MFLLVDMQLIKKRQLTLFLNMFLYEIDYLLITTTVGDAAFG